MRMHADLGRRDHRSRGARGGRPGAASVAAVLVAAELAVDGRVGREVDARQERLVAGPVVEVGGRDDWSPRTSARGTPPRKAMIPGRPVTRRASLSAPSMASEPELRNNTESSGTGNVAASSVASRETGSAKPERVDRPDEPVDLGVDRRGHPRVDVAERRDRDAVREVEVGAAVGVVQPMALAVAPLALEVAPEDGRSGCAGRSSMVPSVSSWNRRRSRPGAAAAYA